MTSPAFSTGSGVIQLGSGTIRRARLAAGLRPVHSTGSSDTLSISRRGDSVGGSSSDTGDTDVVAGTGVEQQANGQPVSPAFRKKKTAPAMQQMIRMGFQKRIQCLQPVKCSRNRAGNGAFCVFFFSQHSLTNPAGRNQTQQT